MKLQHLFIVAVLLPFLSCSQHDTSASQKNKQQDDALVNSVVQAQMEQYKNYEDTTGPVIATIRPGIKAVTEEEKQYAENGILGAVSIEKYDKDLINLIDGDEIVLPYPKVSIIADYPLNKPAIFELKAGKAGFSRREIIQHIGKIYHHIYETEEASAKTKTVPLEKRTGLINRNVTDGEYGIWGHDLSDLYLSYIEVHQHPSGTIYLILGIDS